MATSDYTPLSRMSKTAICILAKTWASMLDRCYNPKSHGYRHWGGRGISVCDRWFYSFASFANDLGAKPTTIPPGKKRGFSLERMNNDGNYEPSNCKWGTSQDQARNLRTTRRIAYNGKTQCMMAWADEFNVPYSRLQCRLRRGWSIEKALLTPSSPLRPPRTFSAADLEQLAEDQLALTRKFKRLHGTCETLADFAREYGLNPRCVRHRLAAGWPLDRALTTPVRTRA